MCDLGVGVGVGAAGTHDFHVNFGGGPKNFIWVLEVDLGL